MQSRRPSNLGNPISRKSCASFAQNGKLPYDSETPAGESSREGKKMCRPTPKTHRWIRPPRQTACERAELRNGTRLVKRSTSMRSGQAETGLVCGYRQVERSPSKASDQKQKMEERTNDNIVTLNSATRSPRWDCCLRGDAGVAGMAPAKMPMGQPAAPYFYRFKLGDAECTIVSDGQLPLGDPSAAFLNITKEEIARELHDNFLPADNAVLEQNVLVANFGDRVVLFDTGMGTDALFGDSTGKLMSTLKRAGIDPAGVDAVVMSYAHIDHCGGLVGDNGNLNFPNAQYFIGEPDFAYWTDDSKIPANYPARPHFLARH